MQNYNDEYLSPEVYESLAKQYAKTTDKNVYFVTIHKNDDEKNQYLQVIQTNASYLYYCIENCKSRTAKKYFLCLKDAFFDVFDLSLEKTTCKTDYKSFCLFASSVIQNLLCIKKYVEPSVFDDVCIMINIALDLIQVYN